MEKSFVQAVEDGQIGVFAYLLHFARQEVPGLFCDASEAGPELKHYS